MLYEDNHVIAVFKPHGWLTQGDATGDPSLMDWVKAWLKERYAKPGNVFLGLLHRIDRPVAGVVLFAKTSKGASRLSEQFRGRLVTKRYVALVEGNVAEKDREIRHWIAERESGGVEAHDSPGGDRKEARLRYRVLLQGKGRTLLEVDLLTGRKHQIRAQLARLGHPIVGDSRYGSREVFRRGAIALAGHSLVFRPATGGGDEVCVEAPALRLRAEGLLL